MRCMGRPHVYLCQTAFIAEAAGATCLWFYIKFISQQGQSLKGSSSVLPPILLWFLSAHICKGCQQREKTASVRLAVGGHCTSAFMLPCFLFRQVNRIEEMTSVTPFMLTTACWIRRPMNAGRSPLLIHSGTIGTASTCFKNKLLPNSYPKHMEIRKLTCFVCHHIRVYKAGRLK